MHLQTTPPNDSIIWKAIVGRRAAMGGCFDDTRAACEGGARSALDPCIKSRGPAAPGAIPDRARMLADTLARRGRVSRSERDPGQTEGLPLALARNVNGDLW
ncbi:hypothetical protein GCM10011320_50550 [Neoroseomonas lacus]|uniref:Uncharacterized protein n=1 Tax=Neoroseomonas lacus TaxID=287609 RepID=A0A917NX02_9PROT|nr:hypothetical protein GCM10011320_50550 [Neoroseomonas lacus]